jgi:hypothetical protein
MSLDSEGWSISAQSDFGLQELEKSRVVTDRCKPELNSQTANTDTLTMLADLCSVSARALAALKGKR